MAKGLYRLGLSAAKRPFMVLFTWLVLLALAAGSYINIVFDGTLTSTVKIPETPTAQTTDRLEDEFPEAARSSGSVVFQTTDGAAFTDEQHDAIVSLLDDTRELDGVEDVVDPFETDADLADQRQEVTAGPQDLDAAEQQLDQSPDQLDAAEALLDSSAQDLDAAQEQLNAGIDQAVAAGMPEDAAKEQFSAQQEQLDDAREQLEEGRRQLADERADYEQSVQDVENGRELADLSARLLATTKDYSMVADDGSAAVATVQFTERDLNVDQSVRQDVVNVLTRVDIDGVEVLPSQEISQTQPQVVGLAEVLGLVVAAVVLVIMLGTFITAGLPIINALVGVGVGVLTAMAFSAVVEMNSVTPVLGVMLGLAVGIDYALFIIHQHRTQLKSGMALSHSIGIANATSGNTVVFAGSTVVIVLLALNLTGIPFLGLMGTVGGFVVIVAVLAAITLTPALLALFGHRVLTKRERLALADPTERSKPQKQLSPMSYTRAVLTSIAAIAVLATAAVPVFSMRLGIPDGASEAPDTTEYQAYAAQTEQFGAGSTSPITVVADVPADLSDRQLLETTVQQAEQIANLDHVAHVVPVGENNAKDITMFQVMSTDDANSESTVQLVHDLRDLKPVGEVTNLALAGQTTAMLDISDALADVLPLYLGVVVGLSLIIMVLVFRSLIVPLIASGGFVLSVGAAMGTVVAIYQWGWLGEVFMVHHPAPVLAFLPTIMLGVLSGLAMNYQLFISSGMCEAYAHGTEARLNVQRRFTAGRSVVTAAAIIMISVFSGFIYADDPYIRSIGFGLAIGVAFDAFLVRMLLVPALVHLLGPAAWYMPKWLNRTLPDVDVEGAKLAEIAPSEWPTKYRNSDDSPVTTSAADNK